MINFRGACRARRGRAPGADRVGVEAGGVAEEPTHGDVLGVVVAVAPELVVHPLGEQAPGELVGEEGHVVVEVEVADAVGVDDTDRADELRERGRLVERVRGGAARALAVAAAVPVMLRDGVLDDDDARARPGGADQLLEALGVAARPDEQARERCSRPSGQVTSWGSRTVGVEVARRGVDRVGVRVHVRREVEAGRWLREGRRGERGEGAAPGRGARRSVSNGRVVSPSE